MQTGILRIDLHIPASRSLKDKRRPLKSLIAKLQNRFHCSVSEVDCHDLHQRAAIGVAIVAVDGLQLGRQLQAVREFVENNPECSLLNIAEERLSGPEGI